METLRGQIRLRRCANNERRWFVPREAVDQLVTEANIITILRDCQTPSQHINELAHAVLDGACMIFVILVMIKEPTKIFNFVKHDQFRQRHDQLDSKLPFTAQELRDIFDRTSLAEEFLEIQWELAIPTFSRRSIPRVLHDDTVLPILEDEIKGRGGFGEIHRTRFHPSHLHVAGIRNDAVIRKVFIPASTAEQDYESELRNLSILNVLKHPNIIELLAAFTYRGQHNLLFPLAEDGDLHSMLRGNTRPMGFQSNSAFFLALTDLSHALAQVHELTAQTLDLRLIGCHHDLKPQNILVHDGTFLLADFGLSNFKSVSQTSSTPHRRGQGDYQAPECEDLEDDFEKHIIHRSSDIWSFGCIIAEVLTFMLEGKEGVDRFRVERRFKLGHYTYYAFHKGPQTPNDAVGQQLAVLKEISSYEEELIFPLIKRMLSLDPDMRPKSKQVTQHLANITILAAARPIQRLFKSLLKVQFSSEIFIESTRFDSWVAACSFPDTGDPETMRPSKHFELDYKSAMEALSLLESEIEATIAYSQTSRHWYLAPVRHLNTRLLNLLLQDLRAKAEEYLQTAVIETDDANIIGDTQHAFESDNNGKRTSLLASIKSMTTILNQRIDIQRPDLEIEPWNIVCTGVISVDCEAGHLKLDHSYKVIVEWINYEVSLQDEQIGKQRHVRAESRAELFSRHGEIENLRVLRCYGYFHDSEYNRFGLVFDFPSLSSQPCEVVSLRQMLDSTTGWEHRPPLEAQFKLARDLVSSFVGYHKIGWLHRNVNSSNVVFFPHGNSAPVDFIDQPYIIGFNHSRPDEPMGFTEGPPEGADERHYQHPEYLQNHYRYRLSFEYYSLGLVLLEIGLWRSLASLTKDWRGRNDEFRRRILNERLFMLKHRIGSRYHDVVRRCLTGDFGMREQDEDSDVYRKAMRSNFEELVVRELGQCVV